MKKIAFLFCILLPIFAFSQLKEFPKNEKGDTEFTEIVECNQPVNIMYSNAKEWIALTFGDYKSVIQFEDETNYKLILKGLTKVSNVFSQLNSLSSGDPAPRETINYTITMEFKEGKYRYRISDIVNSTDEYFLGSWKTTKTTMPEQYNEIIKAQEESNQLKAKDKSLLKKKEIKDLEESISNLDTKYSTLAVSYAYAYSYFPKLIQSLKESIDKNNGF
jgi:hypothetical protein